jgi:8-oxo-dGTP pyrophosphatase MutT (NUDIX family)
MLRGKKTFLFSLIIVNSLFSLNPDIRKLSEFDYSSASVLLTFKQGETKYVILTREMEGINKGTYSDFGGKRDEGENHPIITAAREFFEEGNVDTTIDLNLSETINYLNKNAQKIIAYTTTSIAEIGSVTYIVNFDKYREQFIKNFYTAFEKAEHWYNREKDMLAIVRWDDFKKAIINQPYKEAIVTVNASVIDPITEEYTPKEIILRPFLIRRLQLFFQNAPYKQGETGKIRFYKQEFRIAEKSH